MSTTPELEVKNIVRISGLGNEAVKVHGFTSVTVPANTTGDIVTCGLTAGSLNFGNVTAGDAVLLWFRALIGNFYLKLGATTGTPLSTDSHLYVLEGESYPIPLNPNATAIAGIRYVGDDASATFEYKLVGQ